MSELKLPVLPEPVAHAPATQNPALREALVALEASFLSEMLKGAGLGEARQSFGGGAGEEQFTSFLRQEQAAQMARAGGIGLAEAMFAAMTRSAP